MLSLTPLLVHSDAVPTDVKAALLAAELGPPEFRAEKLKAAAHSLHRATGLECADVRELVGLGAGACS